MGWLPFVLLLLVILRHTLASFARLISCAPKYVRLHVRVISGGSVDISGMEGGVRISG